MSLQPYKDNPSTTRELELLQARITPEEAERRQREAEELDAKLRRIIEDVPDNEYSRMGSNAGANSKTFDQYRYAKKRELERVRKMEEAAAAEERKRRFQEALEQKNSAEEAKTAARRAKRQKKKKKLKKANTESLDQPVLHNKTDHTSIKGTEQQPNLD